MLTDAPLEASRTPDAQYQPEVDLREEQATGCCARFPATGRRAACTWWTPCVRQIERRATTELCPRDVSGIRRIDTAGAWLIERLIAAFDARGIERSVTVDGESEAAQSSCRRWARRRAARRHRRRRPARTLCIRFLEAIGRAVYDGRDDFIAAMYILGSTIRGAQMKLGRGHAVNSSGDRRADRPHGRRRHSRRRS